MNNTAGDGMNNTPEMMLIKEAFYTMVRSRDAIYSKICVLTDTTRGSLSFSEMPEFDEGGDVAIMVDTLKGIHDRLCEEIATMVGNYDLPLSTDMVNPMAGDECKHGIGLESHCPPCYAAEPDDTLDTCHRPVG